MENKNTLIVTIISVAVLVVGVVGATYAYFAASVGTGASTNISVQTKTTDTVSFNPGTAISIVATQQNFYEGAGNQTGTTTATAVLTANNTAAASYCYTVDFIVTTNTFVKTSGSTAELTLTLTKSAAGASAVTLLNALDITLYTAGTTHIPTTTGGSVYIHQINAAAGATVTDTFVPTVTFINLATDQASNEGKTFSGTLTFTKVACS